MLRLSTGGGINCPGSFPGGGMYMGGWFGGGIPMLPPGGGIPMWPPGGGIPMLPPGGGIPIFPPGGGIIMPPGGAMAIGLYSGGGIPAIGTCVSPIGFGIPFLSIYSIKA